MSLPNIISLGRLLAVPVAVWLILDGRLGIAFWVFVAAGVSDAVDGFLAKRFNMQTELGKVLDPLADKALLVSVYISLGHMDYIPVWLVILVVFRDFVIVGGIILAHTLSLTMRMKPFIVSKINTVAQILLAAIVLASAGAVLDLQAVVMPMVYLVGVTTAISGAAYLIFWGRFVAVSGDGE